MMKAGGGEDRRAAPWPGCCGPPASRPAREGPPPSSTWTSQSGGTVRSSSLELSLQGWRKALFSLTANAFNWYSLLKYHTGDTNFVWIGEESLNSFAQKIKFKTYWISFDVNWKKICSCRATPGCPPSPSAPVRSLWCRPLSLTWPRTDSRGCGGRWRGRSTSSAS